MPTPPTTRLDMWEPWPDVLDRISWQTTKDVFATWFKSAHASMDEENKILTVHVKNNYAKEWLEKRMCHVVRNCVEPHLNGEAKDTTIRYMVGGIPSKPAPSPTLPTPPKNPGPGHFKAELVNADPLFSFITPSIYAMRFWQPLLGSGAYGLWLCLYSFAYEARIRQNHWPTIALLSEICANGNRHQILGRNAQGGKNPRPARPGWLRQLAAQKLIHVRTEGGGKQSYYFKILEKLPLLTNGQVSMLPDSIQREHKRWLLVHSIDFEEWSQTSFTDGFTNEGDGDAEGGR